MPSHVPGYWPFLQAYHRVREPLYRQIIADAGLVGGPLILDAGCGDGFYSRLLADAAGPRARVVAVDLNPGVLNREPGARRIEWCLGDLEQAGLRRGAFDAVWHCRALHSALDPARRLAALAALLRSGGKLIVVENDFENYPILSLPTDFSHRIREAHYQYLKSLCADGTSLERYHAARHLPFWLDRIGLRQVSLHTYLSEDFAPMAADVEGYWKLFADWLADRIRPFLSPDDQQTYRRTFDPNSPDYAFRRAGFYCLELTTVACAIAGD